MKSILVILTLLLSACNFGGSSDVNIPPPSSLRSDLLYGYYGTMNNQVAETKGTVNVLWEAQFQGQEKAVENILSAQTKVILDVSPQTLYKFQPNGRNYRLRPDAEYQLRTTLDYFRSKDALKYIYALVPMDEPNTNVESDEEIARVLALIKQVTKDYPELQSVKYAVIYAAKPQPYPYKHLFDIIGVDDYEAKSEVLMNGTYSELIRDLLPNQSTIILPGGAFGQNPTPFYNFAHTHPEVSILLPFAWLDPMQPADKWVGIRSQTPELKSQYENIGRSIVSLYK